VNYFKCLVVAAAAYVDFGQAFAQRGVVGGVFDGHRMVFGRACGGRFGSRFIIVLRNRLMRGFDDNYFAPHSRYTEVTMDQLLEKPELEILALSHEAGVFGVKSADNRRFFVFAHPEYDDDTLALEYFRDVKRGLDPDLPANYFPGGNPSLSPIVNWRSAGQLLYTNWLNYYVYQTTPYDPSEIPLEPQS